MASLVKDSARKGKKKGRKGMLERMKEKQESMKEDLKSIIEVKGARAHEVRDLEALCPVFKYYNVIDKNNREKKMEEDLKKVSWAKVTQEMLDSERQIDEVKPDSMLNVWRFILNSEEIKQGGVELLPEGVADTGDPKLKTVVRTVRQDQTLLYVRSKGNTHTSVLVTYRRGHFLEDDYLDILRHSSPTMGIVYVELIKVVRKVRFCQDQLTVTLQPYLTAYSDAMEKYDKLLESLELIENKPDSWKLMFFVVARDANSYFKQYTELAKNKELEARGLKPTTGVTPAITKKTLTAKQAAAVAKSKERAYLDYFFSQCKERVSTVINGTKTWCNKKKTPMRFVAEGKVEQIWQNNKLVSPFCLKGHAMHCDLTSIRRNHKCFNEACEFGPLSQWVVPDHEPIWSCFECPQHEFRCHRCCIVKIETGEFTCVHASGKMNLTEMPSKEDLPAIQVPEGNGGYKRLDPFTMKTIWSSAGMSGLEVPQGEIAYEPINPLTLKTMLSSDGSLAGLQVSERGSGGSKLGPFTLKNLSPPAGSPDL